MVMEMFLAKVKACSGIYQTSHPFCIGLVSTKGDAEVWQFVCCDECVDKVAEVLLV